MISKDFLFSRQAVVDNKSSVKANSLFYINNILHLLFTDLSVVDLIKHQPIFIKVSIDE